MSYNNKYQDEKALRCVVDQGRHRKLTGGLWNELGQLQLNFLKSQGLAPHHTFIDIGCGALRGGIKFARYLEPGNYYGIDISKALLDAGRGELEKASVSERVPPDHLRATGSFNLSEFPHFSFGICQSVFTHMPLSQFSACLDAARINFEPNGRLFATFFTAPAGVEERLHGRGHVTTFATRDPFHFSVDDILSAARAAGWHPNWIGEWDHPRDQQICELAPLTRSR